MMVTAEEKYGSQSREQLLDLLGREILAARLKIDLDRRFGRPTSPSVKKLAALEVPSIAVTQPWQIADSSRTQTTERERNTSLLT